MRYLKKFNEELINFSNFEGTHKGNLLELGKFINEKAKGDNSLYVPKSNHWIYAKSNMVLAITNDYEGFYDATDGPITRDSHHPFSVDEFLTKLKINHNEKDEFQWEIDDEITQGNLYGIIIKVVPSNKRNQNLLGQYSDDEIMKEVKRRGLSLN
jgi:hypothetical protein